ncbi:hypothetical protein GR294_25920 [Raoultella sp. Lac2]|nr:hypothetical protein [Raoultella sp. Lac2]MXF97620.1 hypothetical protein [Raoultella sp. Lac1]
MTDITELAQREKFEAWAEHACAAPWGYPKKRRTTEGYSEQIYTCMWTAWKAASAELVEALERAQQRIGELENYAEAEATGADKAAEDSVYWMKRCKELESRTVKLPDLRQIVSGGRYVWSDGVFNYSQDVKAALTAAGIKWEGE